MPSMGGSRSGSGGDDTGHAAGGGEAAGSAGGFGRADRAERDSFWDDFTRGARNLLGNLMDTATGVKEATPRTNPYQQTPGEAYGALRNSYRNQRGLKGSLAYESEAAKAANMALSSIGGPVVGTMVGQAINAIERDRADAKRAAADLAATGFTPEQVAEGEKSWRETESTDLERKSNFSAAKSKSPGAEEKSPAPNGREWKPPPTKSTPAGSEDVFSSLSPQGTQTGFNAIEKKRKRRSLGYFDMRQSDPFLSIDTEIFTPTLHAGDL